MIGVWELIGIDTLCLLVVIALLRSGKPGTKESGRSWGADKARLLVAGIFGLAFVLISFFLLGGWLVGDSMSKF